MCTCTKLDQVQKNSSRTNCHFFLALLRQGMRSEQGPKDLAVGLGLVSRFGVVGHGEPHVNVKD
jgi:hypothetical protein